MLKITVFILLSYLVGKVRDVFPPEIADLAVDAIEVFSTRDLVIVLPSIESVRNFKPDDMHFRKLVNYHALIVTAVGGEHGFKGLRSFLGLKNGETSLVGREKLTPEIAKPKQRCGLGLGVYMLSVTACEPCLKTKRQMKRTTAMYANPTPSACQCMPLYIAIGINEMIKMSVIEPGT